MVNALFVGSASIIILLASTCALAQAHPEAPTIAAMRAFLFENKTGKLSEDVLGGQKEGLWNRIAGQHAANAVLIVVELSGPPDVSYGRDARASVKYGTRLVAVEQGRRTPLLDQSQSIPALNQEGRTYVAFLVHPNGCVPVRLTANIVGSESSPRLEKRLNFACGE